MTTHRFTTHRFTLALITTPLAAGILAGCATNDSNQAAGTSASATAATATGTADAGNAADSASLNSRPTECGLQEIQGPEGTLGPIDLSIKFFQPGEMMPSPGGKTMLPYADSQMHLEVDTKANAFGSNWGYSVDETPAALTMAYRLTDQANATVAQGAFMEMNAIDGSHYGTNLAKNTITKPGDYTLKVTVFPPADYNLHTDYITGVPEKAWFKPLTIDLPWSITQEQLDRVAELTREQPNTVPDNCTAYPVKTFEDDAAQKAMDAAEAMAPLPRPQA